MATTLEAEMQEVSQTGQLLESYKLKQTVCKRSFTDGTLVLSSFSGLFRGARSFRTRGAERTEGRL